MTTPIALALLVAAQNAAPAANGLPPWVLALGGLATIMGSVIASWFTAKTKTEKLSALAQTVNAIPTAWAEVLRERKAAGLPDVPYGMLVGEVLAGAAKFTERALTEAEAIKARAAVIKATPDPTALAKSASEAIAAQKTAGTILATKASTTTTPEK